MTATVRPFLIALAAASTLGLLLSNTGPAATAGPRTTTHTVVIDSLRFDPQVLTVKAGDTIVWINRDPFPHTVTAEGKHFDSHEIASGQSWRYTARKAGEFAYACVLHPTMKATLRVE
jgi:plastocyanin